MFEDSVSSIPSIWSSINSWFTPPVFFILLNVMIGIIYLTSKANQQHHHHHHQNQTQHDDRQTHQHQQIRLERSPSVLQRLRSINLYSYRSREPNPSPSITTHFDPTPDSNTHYDPQQTHQSQTPETETQNDFQQTHFEQEEEEAPSLDEVYSMLKGRHVIRTKSDTKPTAGEMPEKLPAKMKKSASAKSVFPHFEEEDIVEARRPATVREGKARATEVDEEVDAKADDFINSFKNQLKLQKLESIKRNKQGMISRGV
ncbi:hypothetical protein ACSBR2_037183 [Camellia fascicularis]